MSKNKKTRTFSISNDVWDKFVQITKKDGLNRSSLIEKYIERFVNSSETGNKIDLIIDKISNFGIESLSKEEINILESQ